MLYLNENDFKSLGANWTETISVIEKAIVTMARNDYSQPIKPYLRFGNPQNRIIAMPAYVGGDCNKAGIKWIASFPDNILKNIPRASSVVILNNADSGEIEAIINTAALSIIRTASVSGYIIKKYMEHKENNHLNVGIVGLGPIGRNHFYMCRDILKDNVDNYFLYDLMEISCKEDLMPSNCSSSLNICKSWREVYENSDIFMCCTSSSQSYIDTAPKNGSLILNVSLRDFKEETYTFFKDNIIVDDWEEVCRENTIIDIWAHKYGLKPENTYSIIDVLNNHAIEKLSAHNSIMFNPMGMAIFDISMSNYFYRQALKNNIGLTLN